MNMETHIAIAYSIGLIATGVAYLYGFSCGIKTERKLIDELSNKYLKILESTSDHTNSSHKEDNDHNG